MVANGAASNEKDLEEAFRLITEGNEKTESKEYWKATESYAQAQSILQRLAETETPPNSSKSEQAMIVALYRQQSAEYLQRARVSLIAALKNETESDRTLSTDQGTTERKEALLSSLSEEDCFFRTNLFGRLFAKELEDSKTILEKESALTARLQQLSDSLPPTFKSEAERVRDLNRGLARLGLSLLPSASDTEHGRSPFKVEDSLPLCESEQVELILAQAKDEVAVNVKIGSTGMTDSELAEAAAKGTLAIVPGQQPDEVDSDDDSVPLSMDDDDADLTPDICKDLHNKLVAAQLAISELVALFDVDQGNDVAIEFEQPRGRALLKQARMQLRQVAEKWDAC